MPLLDVEVTSPEGTTRGGWEPTRTKREGFVSLQFAPLEHVDLHLGLGVARWRRPGSWSRDGGVRSKAGHDATHGLEAELRGCNVSRARLDSREHATLDGGATLRFVGVTPGGLLAKIFSTSSGRRACGHTTTRMTR